MSVCARKQNGGHKWVPQLHPYFLPLYYIEGWTRGVEHYFNIFNFSKYILCFCILFSDCKIRCFFRVTKYILVKKGGDVKDHLELPYSTERVILLVSKFSPMRIVKHCFVPEMHSILLFSQEWKNTISRTCQQWKRLSQFSLVKI